MSVYKEVIEIELGGDQVEHGMYHEERYLHMAQIEVTYTLEEVVVANTPRGPITGHKHHIIDVEGSIYATDRDGEEFEYTCELEDYVSHDDIVNELVRLGV